MYRDGITSWDRLTRAVIRRSLDGEPPSMICNDLLIPLRLCNRIRLGMEVYTSKYSRKTGTKYCALFGLEALCANTASDSRRSTAMSSHIWNFVIRDPKGLQRMIATALNFTNSEGRIVITPASVIDPTFVSQMKKYLAVARRVPDAGLTIQVFEYRSCGPTAKKTVQFKAFGIPISTKPLTLAPKNSSASYLEHLLVALHEPSQARTVLSREWLRLLVLADIACLPETWKEFARPARRSSRRDHRSQDQGDLFLAIEA